MTIRLFLCGPVLAVLLFLTLPAQAAVIITAVESGGDVIFSTDGGTLDLTGLSFVKTDNNLTGDRVKPSNGDLLFTALDEDVDVYEGISGPLSFGSGLQTDADSVSGDSFLMSSFSGAPRVGVGTGFVSGGTVGAASMTFNGATLASLGITPGTYEWTWAGDSVTLNATVPVPAAAWLFASGLGLLGWIRRGKVD